VSASFAKFLLATCFGGKFIPVHAGRGCQVLYIARIILYRCCTYTVVKLRAANWCTSSAPYIFSPAPCTVINFVYTRKRRETPARCFWYSVHNLTTKTVLRYIKALRVEESSLRAMLECRVLKLVHWEMHLFCQVWNGDVRINWKDIFHNLALLAKNIKILVSLQLGSKLFIFNMEFTLNTVNIIFFLLLLIESRSVLRWWRKMWL
jgi:hypothetical protein